MIALEDLESRRGAGEGTAAPTARGDVWRGPANGARTRPRVLYVEDEQSNRRLMATAFAQLLPGVDLILASQGSEGLTLAFAELPQLVLLDGQLPDMTGQDVAANLHADERTRAIPIVMVSGRPPDPDRRGVAGHLIKPIDLMELQALVASFVGTDR